MADTTKTGGLVASGWCRAVRSHKCSTEIAAKLTSILSNFNSFNDWHYYNGGDSYFYISPLQPTVTRACIITYEESEDVVIS